MGHNYAGVPVLTLEQPASQPEGATRRLGLARPWAVAEAASRKPVTLWCRLMQTGGDVCGR